MRHYQFVAALLVATGLLTVDVTSQTARAAEPARLITYEHEGQTFYALSLMPNAEQRQVDASSVVVLFDTSASQQGAFRVAAIESLNALVDSLRPGDRVELMAVDLDAKALTDAPAAPGSLELTAAMEELSQQIPLGSTDLAVALEAASDRLAKSNAGQRSIVYIGDGMSVANLLDTQTLSNVVNKLRETRTSVTSYAVGPKVDTQLLAVLANQTGGNLFVQHPMVWQDDAAGISDQRAKAENLRNAQIAGKQLADWTKATVMWPKEVQFSSELGKIYPAVMPPLRADRDSIVLGVTGDKLPNNVSAQIVTESAVGLQQLSWSAEPEASLEDHAFLLEIVGAAKSDEGLSLPTVGSVGLAETARLVGAKMDQLTKIAERAVAAGDHQAAQRIAQAVLKADPGNVQARTVQHVVAQAGPGDRLAQALAVPSEPIPTAAPVVGAEGDITIVLPATEQIVPGSIVEGGTVVVEDGLLGQVIQGGQFLDEVEQERRVYADLLSKEVQNTLIDARAQLATTPQLAIQDLKLALESVQRAADLAAEKRAELVGKLRNALKEAHYQASLKDELDRQRQEELAASRAQKLLNERLTRRIEREKQLMDRFNALVDERRYLEAEEVATIVEEIDPNGVTPRVATHWARFKRHDELQMATRAARHRAAWETMYQIEIAHIPFPGTPPIVYPDPEYWEQLTRERRKWASVDLSAQSEAEENIQAVLRQPLKAPLEYDGEQLDIIMETIQEEYDIPIVFDRAALDEVAISAESEVTVKLRNVSLRSALNIMFKEPGLEDLTYVIDEEVLLITTEEKANETLTVKVYPVADLVLPVQTPQIVGGGGGGLGGGGGGGLGGGGGGLGGGGGGLGGGGGGGLGGGGGGGGFFNVADDVETDSLETDDAKTVESAKQPETKQATSNQVKTNWQARFAKEKIEPAVVRQETRKLMRQRRTSEAIELLQAALQQGQAQPWMYESLGIAMELDGREKSEIERVIMSACDFSSSPEEMMLIAQYLSHIGIDSRAIEVYRQIIKNSPLHYEAYALSLRAAQRTDDAEAIRWSTVGVLAHDWPVQQQEISRIAHRVAKAMLAELKEAGDTSTYKQYYSQLEQALARDIIVKATWSGDADVDLLVEEPGGTVCSLHEPRTSGGGVSLGDDYSSHQKQSATGHNEQYVCAKGFPGTYRVRIRKVWGDVVADKVTLEVYKNYGSENQRYEKQRIAVTDDTDAMVIFEVEESRREQPLEDEQLQVAVNRQRIIGQAVLAQQLAGASDPRISPIRPDGRGGDLRDRLALAGQGAVGFQPIIQTLPAGTQLVATGVVSADRRYVRISASPSFTGIGDVQTFSFASQVDAGGGGGAGFGGGGGGI